MKTDTDILSSNDWWALWYIVVFSFSISTANAEDTYMTRYRFISQNNSSYCVWRHVQKLLLCFPFCFFASAVLVLRRKCFGEAAVLKLVESTFIVSLHWWRHAYHLQTILLSNFNTWLEALGLRQNWKASWIIKKFGVFEPMYFSLASASLCAYVCVYFELKPPLLYHLLVDCCMRLAWIVGVKLAVGYRR